MRTQCYFHLIRLLAVALMLLSVATAALVAAQFEGIVESQNVTTDETGTQQTFTMTMFIRKDMVKIQSSAIGSSPPSTMIYRNDKRAVWMLNEEEKSYFEIPQDEKAEELPRPSKGRETESYKVSKTGKHRKILGYPCEQIFITRDDEKTEIWGTKSLSHLFKAISTVLGEEHTESADDWANKITKMGYFPLISTTKIEGSVAESQEVTRIEKKTLPVEFFDLPGGYRKQSVGQMLENGGR